MAHDPRYERSLSPEDVAAKVAEILESAERDAWAMIDAARQARPLGATRPLSPAPRRRYDDPPSPAPRPAEDVDPDGQVRRLLAELTAAVESLGARVEAIESTIRERFDALSVALARAEREQRAAPTESPSSQSPVGGGRAGGAERMRAVDLALRGFSRAQIAAELRGSLDERAIEALLDDVLDAG
jgi:hypothetical protein